MGVDFYLYFPSRETAEKAATELRREGYIVVIRDEPDEKGWLAVVGRDASDPVLADAEKRLTEVAEVHGGEYGGFDRVAEAPQA